MGKNINMMLIHEKDAVEGIFVHIYCILFVVL